MFLVHYTAFLCDKLNELPPVKLKESNKECGGIQKKGVCNKNLDTNTE